MAPTENDNNGGSVADLTLRLLRDIQRRLTFVEANMVTKADLASLEKRLSNRMDKLEGRMDKLEGRMDKLEERMDNLVQVVKGQYRVVHKRLTRVEDRVGIRRPS